MKTTPSGRLFLKLTEIFLGISTVGWWRGWFGPIRKIGDDGGFIPDVLAIEL